MTTHDTTAQLGSVTDLPAGDLSAIDLWADRAVDAPTPVATAVLTKAISAAASVADAAGLRVRSLTALEDLDAVQRLYEQIWRPGGANAPATTELLRALGKAGSYVGGAFDGDDLVGACIGFFGAPASALMHSHIAGVSPHMQGRQVGFALKVHQRAWALLRGVREISWTFDPLIARNAYFNIDKLAAEPVEYLPNFYGPMNDGINGGDDTDRLLVSWQLDTEQVAVAAQGRRRMVEPQLTRDAVFVLAVSPTGAPVPAPHSAARTVLVAVPRDVERMRATDPRLAGTWRAALRDVLGGLLAEGARVRGFDRAGWYVLDRKDES